MVLQKYKVVLEIIRWCWKIKRWCCTTRKCGLENPEYVKVCHDSVHYKQAVPINGDNIPPLWSVPTPSRNTQQIVLFLSHCGSYTGENHSRKICLRRISAWLCPLECHGMEGIEAAVDTKSLGNVKKVFAKSCGNPDFRSIFGHQRAKNEGTNTKIDRGPETYPISINPWDEMNRADSFREKLRKPRFSVNFWPPEGQKWGHEHENR